MAHSVSRNVKTVPRKTSHPSRQVKATSTKDFAAKVGKLNSK